MYVEDFFAAVPRARGPVVVLWLALALLATVPSAAAQNYEVIHNFAGLDGYSPWAGVTLDAAGNLYGSAQMSFAGFGKVYKLKHAGDGWLMTPLASFSGGTGTYPESPVVFAPGGSLMGTTSAGGSGACQGGCGLVYAMRAPQTPCRSVSCPWSQQVVYQFSGTSDGAYPWLGKLTFDQSGNAYGTAAGGGASNHGVVYELSRSNGGWTEKVLYSFAGGDDGAGPVGGVIFDATGNLYGATQAGGGTNCNRLGCGTVFKLTPSGSGWTETILHRFETDVDGLQPWAGLTLAPSGSFYGATYVGGLHNAGVIFELTPSAGGWIYSVLHRFDDQPDGGGGPLSALTLAASGTLYGTTFGDGNFSSGSIFSLVPSLGGGWTFTNLYSFIGQGDGLWPGGGVTLGADGTLYGTTSEGGQNFCDFEVSCGVIWKLPP